MTPSARSRIEVTPPAVFVAEPQGKSRFFDNN